MTFRVPSLDQACARAVAHSFRIVGHDDSDPDWTEAFLYPKEALGIVVQLAESRGATGAPRRPVAAPAGPADPPPAVTVLGLRMRTRSAERADTLWGAVLQARRDDVGGALVYRRPGSPMRIGVDLDAGADEGPLVVEFASERAVDLPGTPHPTLGTSFRRSAR